MRVAARFLLNQELSMVCSISLYMDHFSGLCLKEQVKAMWHHGIKTLLDLDYANDLSTTLDESVRKWI